VTGAALLAELPAGLGLLLRATLLMVTAWAGAAALRQAGASAAARHTAWLLCIAALLALPLLRWLVPALQLPLLPPEAALPVGTPPPEAFAASAPASQGSSVPASPEAAGWGSVLLAAYAFGAVALLLRIAAGRWMLARLWRDAEPAADEAWETLLSRLSRELRLTRRVELRIAPGPVMPMTWGTLAPRLLLPAEASGWPTEQRRLVLLHELAHVARRDSLSRSAASLACALYWFHPGAWFAARRMRIEQEHAADDRVLTAGGSAQAYARSLLHLARGMGGRPQPALAATMAGTCQLERRLASITRPARRDPPNAAFISSSAALAALATLVAAAAVPVRASSALLGRHPAPRSAAIEQPASFAAPKDLADGVSPVAARSATQADGQNALDRPRGDAVVAANLRRQAPAHAAGQIQRAEIVDRDIGPGSRSGDGSSAQPQAATDAQRLPDYGWGLRRAEPNFPVESVSARSQRARLPSPPGFEASRGPAARPKWARFVPQLATRGTSPYPLPLTPDRTVTLTLSTNVP
jgi:beta-lactamase regulating signal transducer with metallopeptidase domain